MSIQKERGIFGAISPWPADVDQLTYCGLSPATINRQPAINSPQLTQIVFIPIYWVNKLPPPALNANSRIIIPYLPAA